MAATSVTGRGLGDSLGKQKPENNAGCGKFVPPKQITKKILPSNCCAVKHVCGNKKSVVCGRRSSIRVCSG